MLYERKIRAVRSEMTEFNPACRPDCRPDRRIECQKSSPARFFPIPVPQHISLRCLLSRSERMERLSGNPPKYRSNFTGRPLLTLLLHLIGRRSLYHSLAISS